MPRVDYSASGLGVHVPGVYERLLSAERERVRTPDPRWARWRGTESGQRGEPAPPEWMQKPLISLEDLEAGRPVTVPRWMIGGRSIPLPNDAPLFRDRTITSFTVFSDDTITPGDDERAQG